MPSPPRISDVGTATPDSGVLQSTTQPDQQQLGSDSDTAHGDNSQNSVRDADRDIEKQPEKRQVPWEKEPENAYNWPAWRKVHLIIMLSTYAFLASAGTSIISPAQSALMKEFGVDKVAALLPLSLYVFALGLGPVLGGPLSETLGRRPVFQGTVVCGALFTLGASQTHNFVALCILRFAAGFSWGPALAMGSGCVVETFGPKTRGVAMSLFILMPFLGPSLGPILGAFAVSRQGWRWTQYILLFFSVATFALVFTSKESFAPAIKRHLAKKRGEEIAARETFSARMKRFALVGFFRPIHMLFTEPLVSLVCLYIAVNFGTLFSFFAAVPYTFTKVYRFDVEQSRLVFLAVVIGCLLGMLTLITCDAKIYRPMIVKFPPSKVPPENRLYPAMIGSIGIPIGLFWYAWTAKQSISWANPAAAMIVFSWGNLCVFVSFIQFMSDTYKGTVVASQASANSLARYAFAGAFPLFIVHLYEDIGIDWGLSIFAFVTTALLPIPWAFFKWGPSLRARSQHETHEY